MCLVLMRALNIHERTIFYYCRYTLCIYGTRPIICVQIILFADYPYTTLYTLLFFYRNMDTCELGFLPCLLCNISVGVKCLVLEGSTEDMVKHCRLFLLLYSEYRLWGWKVCSSGHDGRERGCSVMLHCTLCHSDESGS
jgi:hypothetical protein